MLDVFEERRSMRENAVVNADASFRRAQLALNASIILPTKEISAIQETRPRRKNELAETEWK